MYYLIQYLINTYRYPCIHCRGKNKTLLATPLPGDSAARNLPKMQETLDVCSIPGSGRSLAGGIQSPAGGSPENPAGHLRIHLCPLYLPRHLPF